MTGTDCEGFRDLLVSVRKRQGRNWMWIRREGDADEVIYHEET